MAPFGWRGWLGVTWPLVLTAFVLAAVVAALLVWRP